MSVRCIRCGTPLQGTAQFCDDCAAQKDEEGFRLGALLPEAAQTSWGTAATAQSPAPSAVAGNCPSCDSLIPAGAAFCPNCGSAAAEGFQYGGFWMRFLAAIMDGIILGVIQVPVGLIFDDFAAAEAIGIIIGFTYTVGFWITQGATPGKMAVGVKIVRLDGSPIGGWQAVGRYFAQILDILTLGIGYLMIAWTPQKRALHDYVAGTMVIKTR